MSDVLIPSPYAFESPEAKAERDAQLRGFGIGVTNLLPGLLAQVLPYRTDETGQTHYQLPLTSAVEAAYGGAGTLLPMAYNYTAGKIGLSGRLPPAPGAETALQHYNQTVDAARNLVPHMDPKNEDEAVIQDIATSAGGMSLPGGVVKPITSLAAIVPGGRMLTHLAVPTYAGGVGPAAGAVFTGAAEVVQEQAQNQLYKDLGLDPRSRNNADLAAQDTTDQVIHPQSEAAAIAPFRIASNQGTSATDATLTSVTGNVTAPQFGATGEYEIPWWQVAGTLALAAGATHGVLKYGGRVFDPAFKFLTGQASQLDTAANRAAHNANLDALDRGQALAGQSAPEYTAAARGEAPLPGKAGTVGTNLAQAGWDQTRVLTELAQGIHEPTIPQSVIDKLKADIGTTNGGATLFNRIAEQMSTGVNDATGTVMPKLKGIIQDYDNLTPAKQRILDTGLYANDELDSRVINMRRRMAAGQSIDDLDLRYNFRDAHRNELRQARDAMLNDPQTNAIAQQIYNLHQINISEGVLEGRITQGDATRILRDRPHYIPSTNEEGTIVHTLGERDMSVPGFQTPNTRAIDATAQHYYQLYKEYAQNKINNQIVKQGLLWQAADPSRARIFNKVADFAPGRTITVYDYGVPTTVAVDNTNVFRALKNNPAQMRIGYNIADAFRRSVQSGTTGVAATVLGGRPFSVINLLRNTMQIASDRAPGTHFGMLDRALQNTTGIGYRGIEPTQFVGSFDQAIRGSAAVTAKNIADTLRNPHNPVTQLLRTMKGQQWTDALAQRMEQRYATSLAAERHRVGATGAGAGGTADIPLFNVSAGSHQHYSPLADQVPGVYYRNGIPTPFGMIPFPGTRGVVSAYLDMRRMLRDIHQEVSDGANSYYYEQLKTNPNLSQNERVLATRRVIGDPSERGASVAMQRIGQSIPYFNPSLQDAVRMMRNLRDNPAAFIGGTVSTLLIGAAASVLTAMLGGDKHVKMLDTLMSSHDRASNITLFHNPDNEHDYTQVSLPQRWRLLYPMVLEMLANGIGAFQARQGEDLWHRGINALGDLFSHNVSMSTLKGAAQGFSDFADILQVPQIAQVGAAVAGYKTAPPIKTLLSNLFEGNPLNQGLVTEAGKPTQLPGQAATSNFVSKDDNTWAENLMGAIGGITGQAMYDAISNGWQRLNLTHDLSYMLQGMVGDAGQSWRDQAPFANMIWGNNVKMTTRNALGENVEAALAKMKAMPGPNDEQLEGATRRGGELLITSGQPKVSPDPVIQQMVGMAKTAYNGLERTTLPVINDLKKQIKAIDDDPHFPPDTKRDLHNQLTGKLNDVYSQVDQEIKWLNMNLSDVAGAHVDVRNFDMQRGLDQFHK